MLMERLVTHPATLQAICSGNCGMVAGASSVGQLQDGAMGPMAKGVGGAMPPLLAERLAHHYYATYMNALEFQDLVGGPG
jgi:hypothetical protein